ncbi:hypothetical protein ASE48_16595 [Mycobacterium sp. Root265]|uniref:hypothetical protein n=1 Tax=Mycobacterium sp. Root265 TaxID=1736504 RepID=UPI00070C40BD|nr:hypothetical protein [Mycobacterium sp. Root265]KRD06106.1 hypothetical protein ASE48_16595 [Mycobacterium sp. Root265]
MPCTEEFALRIASVPASHVYVQHLSHPGELEPVVRLNDPVPTDGRKVPGGWWPPLMLESGWIAHHHDDFDAFHIHFGFDAVTTQDLVDVVEQLERHQKPLIYTVHDLRNPHHPDPSAHEDQQDVLVAAAHTLITLTEGAARAVEDRWGRRPHVLPHPHVLGSQWIERPRSRSEQFVVGVHVKSLRANMDPLAILDTLVESVTALPGAVLQIDVHDEIFEQDNHWFAPDVGRTLLEYQRNERVRVAVHPYFTDAELWDYLASLNVSVLPYRFGSHSGWLEACHDLGTEVIAPSCGFYREQRQCEVFELTEGTFDENSLHRAVSATHRRWSAGISAPRASWADRYRERVALSAEHARLYDEAAS